MALGSQLPVRLEPEVQERLERVAAQIGTSKSALIRLLARTFVEQMVKPDGTVQLPPQWSSVLPPADKRSATRPPSTIEECSRLLLKLARKEKAKTKKQEQERLRPLAERLEQMKQANDRLEARMKADSKEWEKRRNEVVSI